MVSNCQSLFESKTIHTRSAETIQKKLSETKEDKFYIEGIISRILKPFKSFLAFVLSIFSSIIEMILTTFSASPTKALYSCGTDSYFLFKMNSIFIISTTIVAFVCCIVLIVDITSKTKSFNGM